MKTLTVAEIREPLFLLLPPIFRECVEGEDRRYSLSAPFAWGDGWACATDGRIFVRAALTPGVAAILALAPDRKLIDPARVFARLAHSAGPVAMPEIPPKVVCHACHGDRTLDCECCDQPRVCEWCDGTGMAWPLKACVRLSPLMHIGPHYAEILARHGVALHLPAPEGDEKPVRFVGEDFDGLLMPLVVKDGEDDRPTWVPGRMSAKGASPCGSR